MIEDGKYIGKELELFEKAHHWKAYYGSMIRPYLKGDVLEAGAGIGGTTVALCDGTQKSWLCLEPDHELSGEISHKITNGLLPGICRVSAQYTFELAASQQFDCILYMDVIEHIEDDAQELRTALQLLKPSGALIILVPAHQSLYTPFDKKIGHFRRYSKNRLRQAIPPVLKQQKLVYLDSAGLLASFTNKMFLQSEMPTPDQIRMWDNLLVPVSRVTDMLTGFTIGKSVLGIWTKP